ncbi:hypothetical protein ACH9DO_06490 [Kocuria sp. M1N1S27]|uniref:hypothetical protein n=1 Tax=Kocuria kalidii TaxID=3376283 RepID=UPI0037B16D4D
MASRVRPARTRGPGPAGISERTVRAIETGTGNPAVAAVANVLGRRLVAEQ